jgi:hypothetical protein
MPSRYSRIKPLSTSNWHVNRWSCSVLIGMLRRSTITLANIPARSNRKRSKFTAWSVMIRNPGLDCYAFTFTPALANSISVRVRLNATVCRSQHEHIVGTRSYYITRSVTGLYLSTQLNRLHLHYHPHITNQNLFH